MCEAFNFVPKASAASLLRCFVWKHRSPPPTSTGACPDHSELSLFLLSSLSAKICFLPFILKPRHLSLNDSPCLFLLWYLIMLFRSYGPFVKVHYVNGTSVILHTHTHKYQNNMASVQVRNQCESGMFKQLKHNLNQNLTTFFLLLSGKWDFSKLPLFKCRRLKWLQGWPPCKHKCFEISFIVSAIVRSAYYIFFCSVISMRLQASQGCIYTT